MRRTGLFLAAAVLMSLSSRPAFADGALAIGQPANVARDGVAVGLSVGYPTASEAANLALAECKGSDLKPSTVALCRVVSPFKNKCAAIAMDPGPQTTGFGWAVAATSTSASERALAKCAGTAGSARRGACTLVGVKCDIEVSSLPGDGPSVPPDNGRTFGFAYASSSAFSMSLGFGGSTALTIQGARNTSVAVNSGANSSSETGGFAVAGQGSSSFGSGSFAGAVSSTSGSSCAGAGC